MTLNLKHGFSNNHFYTLRELGEGIVAYQPITKPELKKLRVLMICGQHARELITSEICYAFSRLIQGQIQDVNYTESLMFLIQKDVAFYIILSMNPNSRVKVENNPQHYGCLRHNPNGVDLNRNFPFLQTLPAQYQFSPPGAEDYGGPRPLSEPETQIVSRYMSEIKPHVFINIHSGAQAILMPYDSISYPLPNNYKLMVRMANLAKKRACPECRVGQSSLTLYEAFGTMMDYAIDFQHVDIAVTLEVYANYSFSPITQCFEFFNPVKDEEISKNQNMSAEDLNKLIEKLIAEKLQQQQQPTPPPQQPPSILDQISQLLKQNSSPSSSSSAIPTPATEKPVPATPKSSPIERYKALKEILGDKIPKEVQARYAYETHLFMGGDPEITLDSFRNPAVIKRPNRPDEPQSTDQPSETTSDPEQPVEKKQKTATPPPPPTKQESTPSTLDITNNVLSTLGV